MTSPGALGSTASQRPTVLQRILEETRATVKLRKRETPIVALEAQAASAARPGSRSGRFRDALASPGIGVIAEFKRRSPSAGSLSADAPGVAEIVSAYERGGAVALSVLTEGPNFDGSLDDLAGARAACGLPILRKDFLVDPYQLHESVLAGADAVLLIVAALDQPALASLHALATMLGLDVLVEVHDRDELLRAIDVGARVVGVNNRDLRDFTVDVSRTERLLADMPAGVTVVSESGIATHDQLEQLEHQGVAAVLVGEALMRAEDPRRALATLLGRARAE